LKLSLGFQSVVKCLFILAEDNVLNFFRLGWQIDDGLSVNERAFKTACSFRMADCTSRFVASPLVNMPNSFEGQ